MKKQSICNKCDHVHSPDIWCGRNCEISKTCKYNVTPNGSGEEQQFCFRGKDDDEYCYGVCTYYKKKRLYDDTKCGIKTYTSCCIDCKDKTECRLYLESPIIKAVFIVKKIGTTNYCDIYFKNKKQNIVHKKYDTKYDTQYLSSKMDIVGKLMNISAYESNFIIFVKSLTEL